MTRWWGSFLRVVVVASLVVGCGDDTKAGVPGGQAGAGSGSLPPCADVCVSVIAAQCPSGPPTQNDCVTGCETIRAGKCRPQYDALFACAGDHPTYSCDAGGFVAVVGCETQDSALNSCIPTM